MKSALKTGLQPARIFRPQSVWRTAEAKRLSILIDAEDYYSRLAEAWEAAEESIYLIGWDLDTKISLRPSSLKSESLGEFINRLLRQKPNLHFHVLLWDFFALFSYKRMLPPFRFEWMKHPRLHFVFDYKRPIESARHEKLVIVDRTLAFVGSTDISRERWDVLGHQSKRDLRRTPEGKIYRPHHDLQAVLEGEAVHLLCDYFQDEWSRSTDKKIRNQKQREIRSLWPKDFQADFSNIELMFSRTRPKSVRAKAVKEIESAICDMIDAAEDFIFIEVQYLSSKKLVSRLIRRLKKEAGPCLFVILPKCQNSFIERKIMSVLQNRQLRRLIQHVPQEKLRLLYPVLEGEEFADLMVHSKLIIVDNHYLQLGSANLIERSMGLDSELNFSLYDEDGGGVRRIVTRLLAEHTGLEIGTCYPYTENANSIRILLDAFTGKRKGFERLELSHRASLTDRLISGEYSDPKNLYASKELKLIGPKKKRVSRRIWFYLSGLVSICIILALLWRYTPLEEWIRTYLLSKDAEYSAMALTFILIGLSLASVLMMPVTLITVICLVLLGPWLGASLSLVVSLAGAAVSYLLGRYLDRRVLAGLFGSRLDQLASRFQGSKGLSMMILVRLLPIAPFGMVNLAAGVSYIPFFIFIFGSFLGLLPSKIILAVFSDQALRLLRNPSWEGAGWVALIALILLGIVYVSSKWLDFRSRA